MGVYSRGHTPGFSSACVAIKGFIALSYPKLWTRFFSTALGTSLGFADCYKCAYRLFFLFAAPFHPLQWTGWAGGCLFIVYLLWGLG